ncbi:MAG: sodium pump decarboxylase subunit gamma [Bacillota bacterium]
MNGNGKKNIDSEIIAVIAAAIAAIKTRPGYRLVVRSMRQVPQSSPVWNIAGRLERLGRKINA